MKYCPDCKHFIYCDPYKMMDYKIANIVCEEFEERKVENGRTSNVHNENCR